MERLLARSDSALQICTTERLTAEEKLSKALIEISNMVTQVKIEENLEFLVTE